MNWCEISFTMNYIIEKNAEMFYVYVGETGVTYTYIGGFLEDKEAAWFDLQQVV